MRIKQEHCSRGELADGGRTVTTNAINPPSTDIVSLADMTSSQLARRAQIIEAVIDLIGDVGADAVQMRDVALRSRVALATVYRYFRSKEHLLAAALEDWQKRLTRRFVTTKDRTDRDPTTAVLEYLRRAQRAFHRNPGMTALMLQMMTSTDPEAKAAIDHMNRTNEELFHRLLDGVAPQRIPNVSFGINAALSSALAAVLAGAMDLEQSLHRVEWVARTLLAGPHDRDVGA